MLNYMLNRAYSEGYEACKNEIDYDCNPYPLTDDRHKIWNNGFNDACEENHKEPTYDNRII